MSTIFWCITYCCISNLNDFIVLNCLQILSNKNFKNRKKKKRTRHGRADWCQIGKGVHQGCILSSCFFNLYAGYIIQNARLDEAQSGIKIAGRKINNLIYADDTSFMAESEEELNSPLMKVKEESEKLA